MLPVAIYGSTSNVVIEVLWHVVMHLKHCLTRLRIINLTRAHSSLHHLHFPFWRLALIRDVPCPSIFSEIVIAVVYSGLIPFEVVFSLTSRFLVSSSLFFMYLSLSLARSLSPFFLFFMPWFFSYMFLVSLLAMISHCSKAKSCLRGLDHIPCSIANTVQLSVIFLSTIHSHYLFGATVVMP